MRRFLSFLSRQIDILQCPEVYDICVDGAVAYAVIADGGRAEGKDP